MNKKLITPTLVLGLAPIVAAHAGEAPRTEPEQKRPNVIFIMSDDHTATSIGVYGSRLAGLDPTPTIDRIGKEGAIFSNCFCTNNISTPSRACIVSGQYSQTTGVLDLDDSLAISRQHLPMELGKLGYQTAVIGKWHLKNQPEQYDYYNVFYGQGEYFDPVLVEKGETEYVDYKMGKKTRHLGKKYKGHSTDIVMDITLDWMENKRKKDQPFFLDLHFKAPHDFFEFNPRYKDYLEDTFIPEPASMWNDRNHGSIATKGVHGELRDTIGSSVGKRNVIRNMGIHMDIDPSLSPDAYKRAAYQEYLKRYLRCVKGVDDNVKRLFDYLEENGLMDNTIIMYTGDQGFFLGEHDYIDKRWMYEEAMRMPFLVRYPEKIAAGTRVDAIVNNVDFAPTIINMCGGETPDYMQGDDFSEILYHNGEEPEDWKQVTYNRYWMHMAHKHSNPSHFGIRTKKYKLIFFYGCNYDPAPQRDPMRNFETPVAWEFYDLEKDPMEMDNRYGDRRYREIIADLKVKLMLERERLDETDINYPHIQKIIEEHWND